MFSFHKEFGGNSGPLRHFITLNLQVLERVEQVCLRVANKSKKKPKAAEHRFF